MSPGPLAGQPKLVGIIGYPLGHSVSPAFQQAAFDHLGLPYLYERWETPPSGLQPRVAGFREGGTVGANVTVPYKEKVIQLLDELDPLARQIGAVNTIAVRDGLLIGHNTDAPGFLWALREKGGFNPRGKRAFVLGAGGSAKAVAVALLQAGAVAVQLSNRTEARAKALVETLRERSEAGGVTVAVAAWGTVPEDVDLIVNATTMGMRGGPSPDESPLEEAKFPGSAMACDLVYNPADTPFLESARRAGAATMGGLPMLVYQGALSFQLWTDVEPPIDVMFEAARKALS
jgi:shikimate dehydrogenase